MDLLKPIKKAVRYMKGSKAEKEQDKKLDKWKKKLESAKTAYDVSVMDDREALYLGTKEVDGNINSDQKPKKKANNVYNVIFEMIESQVNVQIPQPAVKSKRMGFDEQAHMIEDSISNDLKEIGIEEINDVNERITPIQGFSIITVDWDPDFKHHLYRGELKIDSKHPKQLIPQPKVWNIQKMDYFFVLSSVTKDYIKRRYDVELEDSESEEYPEVNSLAFNAVGANKENEPVTEIVCWYKDKDNEIGKLVWVNDEVLEDLPKYFNRRLSRCVECEKVKTDEICECGSKRFSEAVEEEETLTEDVMIADGTVLPAGTQVPYFVPTRYPIVIRKNVPKNFAFEGQSDVDTIRDQQDAIKKVATTMERKLIESGAIITAPEDLTFQLTNEPYQVVRGTLQNLGAIGVKDLKADITADMAYIEQQRKVTQYMLGITNSFQGLEDSTAQSGKAKQIQVQQASGRMLSKQFNKFAAFKELFEIMFEFKLAFYDELRPYLSKDMNGNDEYGEFSKYRFLCRDASGKLYYNTDFIFSADAGSGLPKDPMFIFNQAQTMFASQAIDQMQYWTILESLNFPQAKQIKKQLEERMQQMAQQQQPVEPPQPTQPPADPFEQAIALLSPEEQQAIMNAPEEQRIAMMQQFMEGVA